jgi:outer membrane protein TolC
MRMRARERALSLLLLATAGAAPSGRPPVSPPVAAPMPVLVVDTPAPSLERLRLREAIERALQRSPAALLAQQNEELAHAQVTQVRAQALPTLTAGGTYTRLDDDRRFGDQVFLPADMLNGNLTLSVPLLAPQKWGAWTQARDNHRAARLEAVDARRQVAVRVAHAYLAVVAAQRVVEVNGRAVELAQAHHEYARKRLGGGVGSQLDEVRAQQLWREEAGRLLRARAELLTAQGTLGVLLGEERPIDAAEPPELPAVAPDSGADTLSQLYQQMQGMRADMLAQQARLRAAQRAVNLRFVDYLPSLVGIFSPMYQNPPSVTQPQLAWQAQLQLVLPLYDGGLRYGVLRQQRAQRTIAALQLQGTVQQSKVDLQVGFGVLQRGELALAEAHKAVELARRAVDIAALSYRLGAATNLELLDAQRRARDSETAAVQAEDEVRRARLDLLVASGQFP